MKQNPEAKLLVIGTGEEKMNLQHLTQNLSISNNVIFAGAIPNNELPAYFATADIFIGPSIKVEGGDTEGFGLTFVEAAMSGCIIVGTNVGGISDIIVDGETGFLVPEKDPKALAVTLCDILEQLDTLSNITTAARQKMISQFDWQKIAEKYREILSTN